MLFWAGARFYRGAWQVGKHRSTDMNTLIAVGTSTAYFYSIVATFWPGLILSFSRTSLGMTTWYFGDTVTTVTCHLCYR